MGRRGNGWRDWRERLRGSRGLEDCLRRGDERVRRFETDTIAGRPCGHVQKLVKCGVRKYVKLRTSGGIWKFGQRKGDTDTDSTIPVAAEYLPSQYRHNEISPTFGELPSITLEVPDFEPWINELWHDFLIEPTPYLVTSAISYLGFVLLVSRYYSTVWQLLCFLFRFVPWDEDLGLG